MGAVPVGLTVLPRPTFRRAGPPFSLIQPRRPRRGSHLDLDGWGLSHANPYLFRWLLVLDYHRSALHSARVIMLFLHHSSSRAMTQRGSSFIYHQDSRSSSAIHHHQEYLGSQNSRFISARHRHQASVINIRAQVARRIIINIDRTNRAEISAQHQSSLIKNSRYRQREVSSSAGS